MSKTNDLYLTEKLCPSCKKKETGNILPNGILDLPCGTQTNADRRWHDRGNGMIVAYSKIMEEGEQKGQQKLKVC